MYSYKEILKRLKETDILEKYKKDKLIEIIQKLANSNLDIDLNYLSNIIFDSSKLGFKLNEHKPIDYNKIKLLSVLVESSLKSFNSINNNNLNNFLILGDNIDALRNLSICYDGDNLSGVDLIYIDPPYNTINSQSYDNKFDYNDWLFEMKEKLIISRDILKLNGSIMISIDDNMHAYLKVICDEIFGEENFLGNFVVGLVPSGRKNNAMAKIHEYVVVYCKDINSFDGYFFEPTGEYESFIRQGSNSSIYERSKRFYPIVMDNENNLFPICQEEYDWIHNDPTVESSKKIETILERCFILKEKYLGKKYTFLLPIKGDKKLVWQNEYERFSKNFNKEIEILKKGEHLQNKIYKWNGKEIVYCQTMKRPISVWLSKTTIDDNFEEIDNSIKIDEFQSIASSNGKKMMSEIFLKSEIENEFYFSSPKPIAFMKKLIKIATYDKPNALILDFFGGSGTTAQAVMELNKEDKLIGKKGARRFIICTRVLEKFKEENKSNWKTVEVGKICYERIFRIMNGYPSSNNIESPKWCIDNKPFGGNLYVYSVEDLNIEYNSEYQLDLINKEIYEIISNKKYNNEFELINKIFQSNLSK